MANVNIKFNNKDYLLSCDDGQEESLKKLTKFLDKKYSELKNKLGNIGENKLLLITTIQLIDEYFDLKQKINLQKTKIDEISQKFKEIRSLAIEYKIYPLYLNFANLFDIATLQMPLLFIVKIAGETINGYFFFGNSFDISNCFSSSLLKIINLEIFLLFEINFLTNACPKLPVPPVIKNEFFFVINFTLNNYFKDNNFFMI